MNKRPRKVISIDEQKKKQKREQHHQSLNRLKSQAKEWGQFAFLLFMAWLIMQQCHQLPL